LPSESAIPANVNWTAIGIAFVAGAVNRNGTEARIANSATCAATATSNADASPR
jgi:hypothetical protein